MCVRVACALHASVTSMVKYGPPQCSACAQLSHSSAVAASSGLWSLALVRKAEDGNFDLFVETQRPLFVPKRKKKS